VRTAAEQEASEILLAARRQIRQVVVRTRHELVALGAQVRAAGCETAPGQSDPSGTDDDFQLAAARDVRGVLRDARSELLDVSRDAANPWLAWEEARRQENGDGAAGGAREEVPAPGLAEKLIAHWRTAAVAFVILAVGATAIVALRPSLRTATAVTTSRPGPAVSTSGVSVEPASTAAAAADQAGARPTPARASQVRPLEQAAGRGTGARTESNAPPVAPVGQRNTGRTSTPEVPGLAATAADSATAEREILDRHQRWFEAFERGDRATMTSFASENFSLVDQRPERASAASGRVARTIHDVRVQVTGGVGAVLSGQIDETTANEAATVAMLSEVWIRRGDEWRLVSVRMVPLSAVPTTLQ
jgi:hypothetical protein